MKLSSINNFSHYYNYKNNKPNRNSYSPSPIKQSFPGKLITAEQYLAFLGGFSLDLQKTAEKLPPEVYPKDIFGMIQKTLQENPKGKTLWDVHFEKYKKVLDCHSLEELKENFPEFKDAKSVDEVDATEDSFLGKCKAGNFEIFRTDEDLTLQLIKLYWGIGLSFDNLSKYVGSTTKKETNLYYALRDKLKIPPMNRRYAKILGYSNKKCDEAIWAQIEQAKEARQQLKEGEPVVILRGSLSDSHKEHISESLKKYWQSHPEKILDLSERQKQFYKDNPQEAEKRRKAMDFAWHKTQEGKSVLKHLNKFCKKIKHPWNKGN